MPPQHPLLGPLQHYSKVLKRKCCLWARVPHFTYKGEGRQTFPRQQWIWMRFLASHLVCSPEGPEKCGYLSAVFLVPISCWSYFVAVVFHFFIFIDLFCILCFVKVFFSYSREIANTMLSWVMCWLCFLIYLRTFIYPFFTRGRPFPLQLLFFGTLFCIYNGFLQGYYLIYCAEYPNDWCTDIRFTSGNYSCRIPKI